MFGYVLPLRGKLKEYELDAYQGIYCGLCHTLGRRYGFLVRMLLNYDFAFLAMILTPEADMPALTCRRCVAHPVAGKNVCSSDVGLDIAADESVILTYWKLRDSVEDASFWRGIPSRVLCSLFRPAYQKAAQRRKYFDRETRECLAELHELEKANSSSLDRTADTFARILRAAAPSTGVEGRDRASGELLYHVGRWIYLVDAWDDLAEDKKRGSYNPLLTRWEDSPEQHREELRVTMRHSLNLAIAACNLTSFGSWHSIVLNVLCFGLPMVEESVFSGQWRKRKKQTGRTAHGK